ncbi:hypothetical protein N7457_009102 [Penicillium paradoxum]|uniref:uncharacterized protein n=1 Tax=Penicillium paradoxum TaxID=176176 RepID=UPI002546722B|nr:uncharacterized protein N7457_009102 [Penicillium paradoxum]KAJ5774206.1 hypothetical protein N7457_009102 [Penicillium paradoxum]
MTEPQSAKRARSNTLGEAHINATRNQVGIPQISAEEVSSRVHYLDDIDPQASIDIFIRAAQTHPDVLRMINCAIWDIQEEERNTVLSFDDHSRSIWRLINITHGPRRSGHHYWGVTQEVVTEIVETIESIADQCGPCASPQTRVNGLSVLRKIGKTIALSATHEVGRDIQEHFQSDSSLVETMTEIINSMTPDEIRAIRENDQRPEALWPKLLELEELSNEHCIHPGLEDVLNVIDPNRGSEDEDEEDEEEQEEEEEEEEKTKELSTEYIVQKDSPFEHLEL